MKFTINQRGKSQDFFFHKEDKSNGIGMRKILTGKTYPLIKGISPKVICDVGANVGATSVFLLSTIQMHRFFLLSRQALISTY